MLGSGNDEARRNACWAVAVAAADTETTSELCRAGFHHTNIVKLRSKSYKISRDNLIRSYKMHSGTKTLYKIVIRFGSVCKIF